MMILNKRGHAVFRTIYTNNNNTDEIRCITAFEFRPSFFNVCIIFWCTSVTEDTTVSTRGGQ